MTGAKREWKDFSGDMKLARSRHARVLLSAAGTVSLALGVIGVFVPVLPTTPFLLLAAACYARASKRFYNRLLNDRFVGEYIQQWRRSRTIPAKAKAVAIATIVITLGSSIVFFVRFPPAKLILAGIGVGVIVYLLRIPTRSSS